MGSGGNSHLTLQNMKTNLFLFCFSMAFSTSLPALTRTWDDGGADANFSTGANWNPDGVPANGDDLVFPAVAPATVTNDLIGRSFGSLSFPAGTTLAGNAFTLTGGITTSAAVIFGGSVTISANVTLGANQTFTCGGLGALSFNGSVGFGARTLTVTGGSTCVFNGLTGSSTAGAKLIKNGNGLLRFASSAIGFFPTPFDLTAGTLEADGSLQAPVNQTGGKLTGSGTINGLTATTGEVEPAAGDLSVAGNVSLGAAVVCRMHLTGPATAGGLTVSGSVTIASGATLLIDAPSFTPGYGEIYQLLTKTSAGAIVGRFLNLPENAEVSFGTTIGRIHYGGGTGNDLILEIISSTHVWDGGAVLNDNWNDDDNWETSAPSSGDVLSFSKVVNSTDQTMDNNFPDYTVFRSLFVDVSGFKVRGAPFALTHGIELHGGNFDLDTSVRLVQDQSFLATTGGGTLHLDLLDEIETNGHILTFQGSQYIVDGAIRGTGGIHVGANSVAVLKDANDYTGPTTVQAAGILTVTEVDTGLGSGSSGTTVDGELVLSQGASNNRTVTETITLSNGRRSHWMGSGRPRI